MANNVTRDDPYRSFNFRVEIDGTPIASFSEVSGLGVDGVPIDYREGLDPNNSVRKLVGLRKVSPLNFKRGYTKERSVFWDMYVLTATGQSTARRNGTVVLRDEAQNDVLFFHFTGGFINKVEGAHMLASGNEVAIESAEMVIETLTMKLAK